MEKKDHFGRNVTGLLFLILLGLLWTVRRDIRLPGEERMQKIGQDKGIEEPDPASEISVKEEEAEDTEETGIRVVLENEKTGGYYHDRVVLSCSGACLAEGKEAAAGPGEKLELTGESPLLGEGVLRLAGENGEKITVHSLHRDLGNPSYEGVLEIRKTEEGLLLINEVGLETYLRYVVPSEMPASYEMEALKAQAVCARTYACKALEEGRMEKYFGDVDDTVSFQVYNNMESHERTDRAVQETAGKVMTSGGKLITAYFFSTSCGHTSTDEVWNGETKETYLKSTYLGEEEKNLETEEAFSSFIQSEAPSYDQGETWYRWKVEFPFETLQERFRLLETEGGELCTIRVKERGESGVVKQLELQGTQKSRILTNEYEIRQWLSPGDLPVERGGRTVSGEMSILPSAYFYCEPVKEENGQIRSVRILGGGYGHGVGMSQNGADQMAQEGKSWEEILNFFFQNIEITEEEEMK